MRDGLDKPTSEIFLPLGPSLLFWACYHNFDIEKLDKNEIVKTSNAQQAFLAREHLFGQAKRSFIEEHFSKNKKI